MKHEPSFVSFYRMRCLCTAVMTHYESMASQRQMIDRKPLSLVTEIVTDNRVIHLSEDQILHKAVEYLLNLGIELT